jgi:hypothetical protein
LFLQKQKIGAELHIYLEEVTYHKRLFIGPNTNDMKKCGGVTEISLRDNRTTRKSCGTRGVGRMLFETRGVGPTVPPYATVA